jgi:DNA-binding NarL/FixJ family response regulator
VLGGTGYLTKDTPFDQVKDAVLKVARDGVLMSRGVGRKMHVNSQTQLLSQHLSSEVV